MYIDNKEDENMFRGGYGKTPGSTSLIPTKRNEKKKNVIQYIQTGWGPHFGYPALGLAVETLATRRSVKRSN